MESLYNNLYDKYSKLKASNYAEWSKANKDQEVKFMNFVSVSDSQIEYLTTENKSLREYVDELSSEVCSLRAKYHEQCEELQEEKQKNIEQLRNMQHEGIFLSNRNERQEDQHVNNTQCSPLVSGDQSNESPRSMSRKRARVSGGHFSELPMGMTRKPASPPVSPCVDLSTGRELSADHPKRRVTDKPLPECCWTNIECGGPCTCLFQNLFESLIGMKVSIVQSEQRCMRVTHQSCGYSFSLTLMNNATQDDEEEVLYNVLSLGRLAKVAPEWMRGEIIFDMITMLPIFFERVNRVIEAF